MVEYFIAEGISSALQQRWSCYNGPGMHKKTMFQYCIIYPGLF